MEMLFRRCFCLGGKNNVLLVATRIRRSTYRFQKLNDKQWENMISDADRLLKRYKDTEAEYLFRNLFSVVQSFYERMQK